MNELVSIHNVMLALIEKGQHSKRYKIGDIWELNFQEIREALENVPLVAAEGVRLAEAVTRCKNCKYNLNNTRQYDDPDKILTYIWCNTESFQENDFCSKGKEKT